MRFKISKLMIITAVLGVNIGWIRAFLLGEMNGRGDELFDFVFLQFFALQLGLWRYLRTTMRTRRFWLGFLVSGLAATATVALMCMFAFNMDFMNWYTGTTSELAYYILPSRIDAELSTNHWDCFLAIIFFLPDLLAACLGGLLAACFFRKPGEGRSAPAI